MAEKPTPEQAVPVNVDPEKTDTESDKNFDYAQPVDAQNGVPIKDWIAEQPFDSAEWLDKQSPVYEDAADGGSGQPTPSG